MSPQLDEVTRRQYDRERYRKRILAQQLQARAAKVPHQVILSIPVPLPGSIARSFPISTRKVSA